MDTAAQQVVIEKLLAQVKQLKSQRAGLLSPVHTVSELHLGEKLRLAICGCGKVAEHHASAIKKFGCPVTLVATIDPNPSRHDVVQSTIGACPRFDSLADALSSDAEFDAVAILLPHHMHEASTIEALQAGKHVLLEKPMALSEEACQRILSVAKASDQVFAVGENGSFWPEVRIAKALIQDGAIGEVVTARAHYFEALASTPFGGTDASEQDSDNFGWRGNVEQCGGGIVLDGGQHWIRGMREFMGEIASVVAVTDTPLASCEGESLAHAIFRHTSGKTSSYQATLLSSKAYMAHATESWFRVTGQHGEIIISGAFEGGITLYNKANPNGKSVIDFDYTTSPCSNQHDSQAYTPASGFMDSFGPQMTNFAQACLSGGKVQVYSIPYTMHCTGHYTLYTMHCTVHYTLYTMHYALYTMHSTHYTPYTVLTLHCSC
jgi:predicted dehydrogenase